MKIEHFAYQAEQPADVAAWYCAHLGFTVMRGADEPVPVRFLADASRQVMLEIYNNPKVTSPDYRAMDPLLLHIAFVCEDVPATTERLVAAGASLVSGPEVLDTGDELAMLRDPWGLAIQLAKRAEPMLLEGARIMPKQREAIEVRAAARGDAGLLATVGRETFDEAFKGLIDDPDLSSFADKRFGRRQQTEELRKPGTTFFIARCHGHTAGHAKLCESVPPPCIGSTPVVELERLYLYRRWHGQGVAHALMEACLADAGRKTYDAIWLDVWEENRRAMAFYRKYRFGLVGERTYVVGTAEQRHLLMCRRLEYAPGHGGAKQHASSKSGS